MWVALFALTAAVVWGWAYPLIKLCFAEFGIAPDQTGSKMSLALRAFSHSISAAAGICIINKGK